MGVSEIRGTLFGGPSNKDPTIQGTVLGSHIFGISHMIVIVVPISREPSGSDWQLFGCLYYSLLGGGSTVPRIDDNQCSLINNRGNYEVS